MRNPTLPGRMFSSSAPSCMWAFNFPVTKYVLTHGFEPLAYAAVRYGVATALFAALTIAVERSLAIRGAASWRFLGLAVTALLLNQICFVYALELDDRRDGGADPRDDAGLHRAPLVPASASSGSRTNCARGRSLVRRRRARRGGLGRRPVRGPRREPPRGRDGGHMGRLLGRDRAADEDVLALSDKRRRPARDVGPALRDQRAPGDQPGLRRARLGGVARARVRDRRAVGVDERALVHGGRARRTVPRRHLREPPSVRRSHPRRRVPRRVADADPGCRRRADRARDPRGTPPRAGRRRPPPRIRP